MNENPYYNPYWDCDELEHHGILGMKWGIRRYQNKDGTLTETGRKRYRYINKDGTLTKEGKKRYNTKANTIKERLEELREKGLVGKPDKIQKDKGNSHRYINKDGTLTKEGKKRYNTKANTIKERLEELREKGLVGKPDKIIKNKDIQNKRVLDINNDEIIDGLAWIKRKNYLEHHGILGQKWGIRRYQNKDGSLTTAGRERYGFRNKLSKVEAVTIKGQSYSKDITFPAGTVGYRVQSTTDIQKDRPLYLSYNKDDHIRYLSIAGDPSYGISVDSLSFNADQNAYDWGNENIYSIELKAKEPIKAPSYQHAMEIFVEMVGDIGIEKLNPYNSTSRKGNDFIESWKNRNIGNLGAVSAYTKFVDTMRQPDRSSFYEDFLNRLEKKGYNALVDPEDRLYTADRGYSDGYKAPFIIMNPTKVLEVSKKIKLSNEDIHYISRNYDLDFGDVNKRDEYMNKNKNSERYSEKDKAIHEKWKKWFNE